MDNTVRNINPSRCRDVIIGGGLMSGGAGKYRHKRRPEHLRVPLEGIKLRPGMAFRSHHV